MIKIEHTLFALPFAFLGAILAANGLPSPKQILWITLAMVGARSTAMAFNRIADRQYDARNPRTRMRAIPAHFGISRSLWIARTLHGGAFAALVGLYWYTQLGRLALIGVIATGALLVYQHRLVRADDLSGLNAAFFTTNAFVSVILFI